LEWQPRNNWFAKIKRQKKRVDLNICDVKRAAFVLLRVIRPSVEPDMQTTTDRHTGTKTD